MTKPPDIRLVPPNRKQQRFDELARQIAERDALEAKTITFVGRLLTHTSLPYRKPKTNEISPRAGDWHFHIHAPSEIGLPYGRYPRLLLAYFSNYAVVQRTRHIDLGSSMADFMLKLAIIPSGGANGTCAPFRSQLQKLASTSFKAVYMRDEGEKLQRFRSLPTVDIVEHSHLWWDTSNQPFLLDSSLTLSQTLFEECLAHAYPVDLRALQALTSPLALDLYFWLTSRLFRLDRLTPISWELLHEQFGSQGAKKEFTRLAKRNLPQVLRIYPEANVSEVPGGLELRPSKPHVPAKRLPT